jgi:hypothetical protein
MPSTCFEPLRVHLQEKGCIYKYGILCLTFIAISSLGGRRTCWILRPTNSIDLSNEHTYLPTRLLILMEHAILCGPGSVVGIATAYGLDGPRIESWWGRGFPHMSRPALNPTQSPVKWVPGLSRG